MFSLFDLIPALNTGLLGLALNLIIYLGLSYGIFAMAKKCDMDNTWMAWVPVARLILLGNIADLTAKKKSHLNRNTLFISVAVYAVLALAQNIVSTIYSALIIPALLGMMGAYMVVILGALSAFIPLAVIGVLLMLGAVLGIIVLSAIFSPILTAIANLIKVVAIAYFVFRMLAFYKAFKLFDKNTSVLYLLLCILFDIAPAILLPVASFKSPDLPAPVAAEPVEAEEAFAADTDEKLAAAVAEAVEATVVADL